MFLSTGLSFSTNINNEPNASEFAASTGIFCGGIVSDFVACERGVGDRGFSELVGLALKKFSDFFSSFFY